MRYIGIGIDQTVPQTILFPPWDKVSYETEVNSGYPVQHVRCYELRCLSW